MTWTPTQVFAHLREEGSTACEDYRPDDEGNCTSCQDDFYAHLFAAAARLVRDPAAMPADDSLATMPRLSRSPCAACGHSYADHTRLLHRFHCQIEDCRCQRYEYPVATPSDETPADPPAA